MGCIKVENMHDACWILTSDFLLKCKQWCLMFSPFSSCSILQNLKNQHRCACMQNGTTVENSRKNQAKVEVSSSLCWAGESRGMMKCCTVTWMNTKKRKTSQSSLLHYHLLMFSHFWFFENFLLLLFSMSELKCIHEFLILHHLIAFFCIVLLLLLLLRNIPGHQECRYPN